MRVGQLIPKRLGLGEFLLIGLRFARLLLAICDPLALREDGAVFSWACRGPLRETAPEKLLNKFKHGGNPFTIC